MGCNRVADVLDLVGAVTQSGQKGLCHSSSDTAVFSIGFCRGFKPSDIVEQTCWQNELELGALAFGDQPAELRHTQGVLPAVIGVSQVPF
jgi:hypothetical protein